ncbi:LURP-one-related/scramblase family protein [Pontibacter pudoricolor]|uniref:hypothetical protein n=1 Tax=Pontibacter pudoricolor TaxID=2694930 RepID=UPI00139115C6|nr:hypothetical protein [Pontibacter pudoricolor]
MQNIQFPLTLTFKISTFSNDFTVQDANGRTINYVKQKLFKFIEEVNVFSDEAKPEQLYTISANKWLDFSAAYSFTNQTGEQVGSVARKGWASLWKARYEIYDEQRNQDLLIQEDNGWVKVADSLLSEIPLLGMFTGYVFNPSYTVTKPGGDEVAMLTKERSFFGRRFTVHKTGELDSKETERVILSLMMMILLERRRG